MSDKPSDNVSSGKTYAMGDVGAFANVFQGENITWIESMSQLPGGQELEQQFRMLLQQIASSPDLDEDTRALAQAKTEAVAAGIAEARQSPSVLRRALLDAKSWFGTTATWVGEGISKILKSESAQKTLATITESSVQGTIKAFTGV